MFVVISPYLTWHQSKLNKLLNGLSAVLLSKVNADLYGSVYFFDQSIKKCAKLNGL